MKCSKQFCGKTVEGYLPLVSSVIASMRSEGWRLDDESEAYQIGVVALLKALPKFDPERAASPEPLLATAVRNAIADEYRKQRQHMRRRVDYDQLFTDRGEPRV